MDIFESELALNVLTAALVVITAIYAALTFSIAMSNKRMTVQVQAQIEAQTRPIIAVNIETRHQTVFSIRISNRGNSLANNVRIRIDRPFFQFSNFDEARNLRNFHLFKEVIPTIAPGDGFLIDLAQGFNLNIERDGQNITPDQFCIDATYEYGERPYRDEFRVDLRPYFSTFAGEREVEELQKIRKILEKLQK